MQIGATIGSQGKDVSGPLSKSAAVARLLRQAPFEEPRIVSFELDFLTPKGPIAYAGNDSG